MKQVLVLAVLVASVRGEEARVVFDFRNESAQKVVDGLAMYAGVKLRLDDEFADRTISIQLKDATVSQAIAEIARALGGKVHEEKKGETRILPVWKAELLARLAKTTLQQADFKHITLDGFAAYLRSVLGAGVVVDPAVARDARIEAKADGITARQTLDLVTEPHGLKWEARYGVVFISTHARLESLPSLIIVRDARNRTVRVDLPFEQTPLPKAVSYLAAATGFKFVIEPADKDFLEALEIDVQGSGLTVAQALALTLLPVGATADVRDGVVTIRRR